MSEDLVVAERGTALERAFPPERRTQLAQFLNVDAENPAFMPFLEIAASYQLDPVLGEIWLIPVKNRIKDGNVWRDGPAKYRPAVGRDGLLKVARRDVSFRGVKFDTVCAEDTFIVSHNTEDPDAPPRIRHEYPAKITERGAIMGAWAICYLRDRPPVYFFASLKEHGRTKDYDGKVTWEGAWSYTSSMIIKAAVSYVLRIGFGVSGLIPYDELQAGLSVDGTAEEVPEEVAVAPEDAEVWDHVLSVVGPDGVAKLRAATSAAGWGLAECELKLGGQDVEGFRSILAELVREQPTEAEVVPEPAATPEPETLPEEPAPLDENEDAAEAEEAGEPPSLDDTLAALARRADNLRKRMQAAEPGSEEQAELLLELDLVEAEQDAAASPAQGSLL